MIRFKRDWRAFYASQYFGVHFKTTLTPYLFLLLWPILSSFFGESKKAELETLVD